MQLWGGYGYLRRENGPHGCHVIKDIRWPEGQNNVSHQRKIRSYQIESHFYAHYASAIVSICRLPKCYGIESNAKGIRLDLEDLDAAGFSARNSRPSDMQKEAVLQWLARFHGAFLTTKPSGLWKEGSYWQLQTRLPEWEQMPAGELRNAAKRIDALLRTATFRTIIHGDAKPDNFCFAKQGKGVAAVDFQYVGGGCGMRDVAYFLDCCYDDSITPQLEDAWLSVYFAELQKHLPAEIDFEKLQAEWRQLYSVAWLDFQRFLQGWSSAYAKPSPRLQKRIIHELQCIV